MLASLLLGGGDETDGGCPGWLVLLIAHLIPRPPQLRVISVKVNPHQPLVATTNLLRTSNNCFIPIFLFLRGQTPGKSLIVAYGRYYSVCWIISMAVPCAHALV